MSEFSVLGGKQITELLDGAETEVIEIVREAYLAHDAGASVNPDSHFLRFPEKPDSRIIALPSFLGASMNVAGLKWIASFPRNTEHGMQRASAVQILNDAETGHPVALLEAAGISAARTAASAALAANSLRSTLPGTVGVVGAGVIARTVCQYLAASGTPLTSVRCHDLDEASATALTGRLRDRHGSDARTAGLSEALGCDLVLLTTTALSPYVPGSHDFLPHQLILNISLRDLAPEILLRTENVLDDVEHCMKADTSPHLAEQLTGGRDFVTGTLADVMTGRVAPDPGRPTVFSPFGLGVLDLAVSHHLFESARKRGLLHPIPDFFGETSRW